MNAHHFIGNGKYNLSQWDDHGYSFKRISKERNNPVEKLRLWMRMLSKSKLFNASRKTLL